MHYKKVRYLSSIDEIVALQPHTVKGRCGCRVLYLDGSWEDVRNKPSYVLDKMAEHLLRTDVDNLKRAYGRITGEENSRMVPILFSPEHIFIPFSMMDAGEENVWNPGYVARMHYRAHSIGVDGFTVIYFQSGTQNVACREKSASVDRQLMRTDDFTRQYEEDCRQLCGEDLQEEEPDYDAELLQPVYEKAGIPLSLQEHQMLLHMLHNPLVTQEELAERMDCSRSKVAKKSLGLMKRGLLWRSGTRRDGRWVIQPSLREQMK